MVKIAELFASNVPRYTSYPTAPHFHAGINGNVYRDWLAELPPDMPLSLYFHIPFCDTLCWFCGCHTTVVNNYTPVREYLTVLFEEIRLAAAALGRRHPVRHIHWGGGSPTILEPADIERLNGTIRDHFNVLGEAEFAIEIDPRGLSSATVKALANAGVTRASIGLQDCNIAVQQAINRIQTDEETLTALDMLKSAGIASLNLDLVYGLPRQNLESWEATMDFALWLNPDRLAIFGYAHVPKFKKHQALIPQNLLPDVEDRFHMAEFAWRLACDHGYVAIGLDHFAKRHDTLAEAAKAGRLARNFQGYTTDNAPALFGFGASAIGSLPQGYVQNAPAVPIYRAMVEAGRLPIMRGIALTDQDRMHRSVIERLMCDLKVDLKKIARQFGRDPEVFSESLEALTPLVRKGVVETAGQSVVVDPQWRSAVRLVAAAFDEYLLRQNAVHSVAV